jgi:hypothetical protein
VTGQQVFITAKPPSLDLTSEGAKPAEAEDPYALTGVRYPVADGLDADREVALAFIEEFALSGWTPDRIWHLFSSPQSGSMHDILRRRGPDLVGELLLGVFGQRTQPKGMGDD